MDNPILNKLRVLFIAPHLSTGGMPGFLLKRIEVLKKYTDIEIFVVEFKNYSDEYVIHKNKIRALVGNRFYTLSENKNELIDIIRNNKIDIVHIDELPERFDEHNPFPNHLLDEIYSDGRSYRIVETSHSSSYNYHHKSYHPDAYAFCTKYHLKTFSEAPSSKYVIEFPIEPKEKGESELTLDLNKKHVINIGLWTPGKNQKEIIDLAREMPDVEFHLIGNQAVNFEEYWQPLMKSLPSNVIVWGERADTDNFMKAGDLFLFSSVYECNPLVLKEAIGYGIPIIARDLPEYEGSFSKYITALDKPNLKQQVEDQLNNPHKYTIPENQSEQFAKDHENLYREVLEREPQKQIEDVSFNVSFLQKPFIEIMGRSTHIYTVRFLDEQENCIYETKIRTNCWAKCNREWYTKWKIQVWREEELIYEYVLDYTGKKVYISIDSSSLGDTIAWIPYCLEFKKKHNCDVVVSTFRNYLFKEVYPELEFIELTDGIKDLFGIYSIGWFYNPDKEPVLPSTIPLQRTATNILGLDYQEIRPRIDFTPGNNLYGKYVTIATNSTAGCKFWTKEGWQEVIDYLHSKGYIVINTSKERNSFNNCEQVDAEMPLQEVMNLIYHSEFFIGLSSGLSWLAWTLGKKVIMIANFTNKDHEFTSNCIRVVNENVCHGCWNNPKYKFDKGDWNWCPVNKNTSRQFECQKSISGKDVINVIENIY